MKLLLFTVAETAIIDAQQNQISIINLLESIGAPTFPIAHPRVCVVAIFAKEGAESEIQKFSIKATLAGNLLFEFGATVDFQSQRITHAIVRMPVLVLPAPGEATFAIEHGGEVCGTWSIDVANLSPTDAATMQTKPSSAKNGGTRPRKPRAKMPTSA
jgi:hypothetical protein